MSRTVALDIDKRFAEVACTRTGACVALAGSKSMSSSASRALLRADDHVVIESTSQTWAVVELIGR